MTNPWDGHAPDLVRDNKLMHERLAEQDRELTQLRGNLSLAEDGLAAAMQEIARRDQQLKESVDHEVDYQRQIERLRALLGEKRTWCDAPLPGRPYPEYACGKCWSCRVRAELIGPAHEPLAAPETVTTVALNRFEGYPQPTYQANTPICAKCGQIDLRIPRMGIYHVCPPSAEIPPEKSSEHHCPTCACPDMRRAGFIK